MKRPALFLLLLPLALAAQEPTENPQTPREFSRAVARSLRQYPELCTRPVRWVLAFDISRSGMGRWSDWARQVVSDLISYTMVEGDQLTLLPFDQVVNPARGGRPGGASYPTWEISASSKGEVREQVAELLLWRQDSPP
ncbi:MAG: hypothetical protein HUU35_08170, partial [Armatimonadetes bacterium]|nr:hypothetical protein [Armatimonadota bacterium]